MIVVCDPNAARGLRIGHSIVHDGSNRLLKPIKVRTLTEPLIDSNHIVVNEQYRFHRTWEVDVSR